MLDDIFMIMKSKTIILLCKYCKRLVIYHGVQSDEQSLRIKPFPHFECHHLKTEATGTDITGQYDQLNSMKFQERHLFKKLE